MPRKAPTNVEEHRITFGNAERKLIKSTTDKMAFAEITKGVGTAIGGLGVAGAAIAALLYVGFNIEDYIDDKSSAILGYLEKKGWVRYQAPVYGQRLEACRAEQEALFNESAALNGTIKNQGFPMTETQRARLDSIHSRMQVLTRRDAVLVSIINDIAEGRRAGYWTHFGIAGFDTLLEREYDQEYFEMYGYGGESGLQYDQDDTTG